MCLSTVYSCDRDNLQEMNSELQKIIHYNENETKQLKQQKIMSDRLEKSLKRQLKWQSAGVTQVCSCLRCLTIVDHCIPFIMF